MCFHDWHITQLDITFIGLSWIYAYPRLIWLME